MVLLQGGVETSTAPTAQSLLETAPACSSVPTPSNSPTFDEGLPAAHPLLRYDPVDHLRHMGQTLWEQRVFTDLAIVCKEREVMRAHRSVMAAASPVLAAMLKTDMSEARERKIVFRETDPSTVKAMMQFIYTASLPKHVDSRAVLNLATMYGVQGLAAHCCHSLVNTLAAENVVESVRVLRACSDNEVARKAYHVVCEKVFADRSLFDIVAKRV
mmetsp:Transcript_20234/g.56121  ORF Transcript_20234/g.56121 Transcript_20234/m.56121 type:complete len:215 (-) Transcript_20234:69-713(-)